MSTELNLRFPDANHVIVRLGAEDDGSSQLPFTNPISDKDLRDIQWYVEIYGAHSLGDPDDHEAARIAGQLPIWGKKLFEAIFHAREAGRRFNDFQDDDDETRLLTISAEHPAILALPWELLHDSSALDDTFLFHEQPSISIRRRVAGADKGRRVYKPVAKDSVHLIFVVSHPDDAGFLDPRADSQAVLDAIDQHAPGQVTYEFLHPPTLDALIERLEDTNKPPVDLLHFDGHGVFDREGGLPTRLEQARASRIRHSEEVLRDKKAEPPHDADYPPNTGYLLFEKPDGQPDFVSADKLGANLHRRKVALVILSACQSATVRWEEKKEDGQPEHPMGSVAARLTATGIPSVLAMTHSVLVHTTRALFGEFYKELARHKGIGEALDNARRHLANHPEKYEVQRGPNRVPLKLYDWFVPALYQPGADGPLLKPVEQKAGRGAPTVPGEGRAVVSPRCPAPVRTNFPKSPKAGFFGRKRGLWEIERWFAGPTRRITLTGFGGQGKTALALEAGRWLLRIGLFQAAVFVDYSRVQAADAVSIAKNEIGQVLDQTFMDADAATAALKQTPTLVILDNLEALAPDSLRALLDAAVAWSEAGGSRVLCTTRRPDFGHAAYRVEGTNIHRRIQLDGLGSKAAPDDALEWCAALMELPPLPEKGWIAPARVALIELFDRVKFHPLSIRVLAQQFKTRRIAELGERLEQLLGSAGKVSGEGAGHGTRGTCAPQDEDTPASLLASLELSLDKLDAAARQMLPRLGVFQGGAIESELMEITQLGDPYARERGQLEGFLAAVEAGKAEQFFQAMGQLVANESSLLELIVGARERIAQLPPAAANLYPGLLQQLEAAALIEVEDIPGVTVPFLRFHPTLAPMLWAQLDSAELNRLSAVYRQRYYALSGYLHAEDGRTPRQVRSIAWLELPNLLHAVRAALDKGDPNAVDFTNNVNKFLGYFGLKQEAETLAAKALALAGNAGSREWYLAQSNQGGVLFEARQVTEATQVFHAILKQLGESPTYERAATLSRLGKCYSAAGQPKLAAQKASEAIAICDTLEQTHEVKGARAMMLVGLGDALTDQGEYTEARQSYEKALRADEQLTDLNLKGVVLDRLGTLAVKEGNLKEAADRYHAALVWAQQLGEPLSVAKIMHHLGVVFQVTRQWHEAEEQYRESARIKEERGDLAGAAESWKNLAMVSDAAGKPDAAELWYRKAIKVDRDLGNPMQLASGLNNLANLLRTKPGCMAEARQLAEEALAIIQVGDSGMEQVWRVHELLAMIADQEAQAAPAGCRKAELQAQACDYRRLAREAKRNFGGTRDELRKFAPLVFAIVAACAGQAEGLQVVKQFQAAFAQAGPEGLVIARALDRILAGERDETAISNGLNVLPALIIETILQCLADPSTLSDLLPSEESPSS